MSFFNKLFGSKQPMDWKAFVTYYADHASKQLGQPVDIEWGDDMEQTTICLPNGQGGSMAGYLGNLYAQYRQSPTDLEDLVTTALTAVMETINTINNEQPSDTRAHIFPVLKNREWVAYCNEQAQQASPDDAIKDDLIYTPMAGDLMLTYAIALNNSIHYLTEKSLQEQQIAQEDLFDLAMQNFLNYINTEHLRLRPSNDSTLVLIELDDGTYNASLLLYVRKLLNAAKLPFANDCICAVPTREAFLTCSADDPDAIAEMRLIAAEFAEQSPYRVSDYLYRVKDGELTLFDEMPQQH